MPTVINPNDFEFHSDANALPQFKIQTMNPRLSKMVESKHLVFDIRKLDPGKYSFPYHYHRNAEELVLIFSGSMTIRTQKGTVTAEQGQLVFFESGESGAHQFYNHEKSPCIYFDLRTQFGIDIAVYPDSRKLNILPFNEVFELDSLVAYNKGENNVEKMWDKLNSLM